MYLDYSKIKSGQMEQPVLRLRTLAGKEKGAIPWAHDLEFAINYSEVSTVQFTVPLQSDGMVNPVYDLLTSYKVVYTEHLGIYVLGSPTKEGDGISETKTVTGYSLEKLFEKKNLFLEEGTYNFWNPLNSEDTILGRIIELDTTWKVGYVDPKLIGCYRTFDEYDNDALSFCYSDAAEKYQCAIVFDVYEKTINAYDASESRGTLPIYLSYQNLVDSVSVEEMTDEIVTKLHVYGSDDLTIRDVNPAGTDYLIDLSYFIQNGDLDIYVGSSTLTLAEKVANWQTAIRGKQSYYTGLVSARASKTAQRLAAESALVDLNADLETLQAQQSVTIQALAMETTDSGQASQQSTLTSIYNQISAKESEIGAKESEIASLQSQIDSYAASISSVNSELAMGKYFTDQEVKILNFYLIEGDLTEETFVATDVDTSVSGATSSTSGAMSLTGSEIVQISMDSKTMYTLAGGTLTITNAKISADVVRGTLEVGSGKYVLTAYLGSTTYESHSFSSGMLTLSGSISGLSSDISAQTGDEVIEYKGTRISFQAGTSDLFFTVNVSEYQKYSVSRELYDYGAEVLDELAWPTYEFTLDSANFLYQKEFEPFKDKLELGKAVYLNLQSEGVLTANIIGITLDFENPEDFTLTFSNRYQKRNGLEALKDAIESSKSTSRSFDASKYLYNQAANKTTEVSQFMEGQLNAAVNTILGAANQSVIINGAGIQVGGDSKYQLRIVDNMIAMTDDSWQTAKLAIGRFATEETGTQWGVNAEMLAGKLIIGNNMVLENTTDDGVMQFKVDATGAWLNNSTFVLQKDNGGRMILDPKYGIVAGTSLLFDTDGTTVKPSFIDSSGDVTTDTDGMPKNANFYLDIRDGSAYFRGKIKATGGSIGGWTLEETFLHGGTGSNYVALNGSGSGTNSAYAMWAGASSPGSAAFYVKKNGELYANKGTFKANVSGATYTDASGNSMMNSDYEFTADYLNLNGINVGNGNFKVDSSGNVTVKGKITMGYGSTINWSNISETNLSDSEAYSKAASAEEKANTADGNATTAKTDAATAKKNIQDLSNGQYTGGTFISGTSIFSPKFFATSDDDTTFARFDANDLIFYSGGVEKISIGYGYTSQYNQHFAIIKLGNSAQAYLMKRYQNSHHQLWIGNNNQTCGVLFDFTAGTYQLYGTNASGSTSTATFG